MTYLNSKSETEVFLSWGYLQISFSEAADGESKNF